MDEQAQPEEVLAQLLRAVSLYQGIILMLLENQSSDGICRVSQTEIAGRLGISPSLVSQRLKRLQDTDHCVTKVASGQYKVNHRDMRTHGPIARSLTYMEHILKEPELLTLPQNVQAERMGLQMVDVQRALAYFKYGVNG